MSLFQWKGGSRMFCGPLEGVVELLESKAGEVMASKDTLTSEVMTVKTMIGVKVRGPVGSRKLCFYFLEELLGIIDQVHSFIHSFI